MILRERTAAAHEAVDASFGGHDLADPAAYRAFLNAHARALPVAEARLAERVDLPEWTPRSPALAADLAALGDPLPEPLPLAPVTGAAAWGLFYVVEGSRLGGAMLARLVGAGLPSAYLSAVHRPGGWRMLRAAIDAEGARHDAAWTEAAVAGALDGFALYARAAAIGD